MITRRYLEKKSTVLGLPMQEVGLLVGIGLLMIIVSSLLKLVAPTVRWFNHLTVVVVAGSYLLLRFAACKKQPSFLLSWISYYLLQKRRRYTPSSSRIIPVRKTPVTPYAKRQDN
jgi:hypothetical protein